MNSSPMRSRLVAVLLSLACTPLLAAGFPVGQFIIDVPARFQGPLTTTSESRLHAYSFTVPGTGTGLSTAMQVVLQQTDVNGSKLTEAQLADTSRRYLENMLLAVERHRTDFLKSEPTTIKLAGAPGSEVTWTGRMNGFMNNGRLFCLATGSDILFMHVMGAGAVPDADMSAAIQSIKSLRRAAGK